MIAAFLFFSAAEYEYPGKWKFTDKNKNSYDVYIDLGGGASSTKGQGQMGEWKFSGSGIQIAWTDGTTSSLSKTGATYQQSSSDGSASSAEKTG